MTDLIITEQSTVEVIKRVRSPQVVIINPESGTKQVIYKVVEATYHNGVLHDEKFLDDIVIDLTNAKMVEDITFIDPISQQEVTLKVATVAKAIEKYFIDKYKR